MNDAKIRNSFHKKRLRRHHADTETLVIDELGLKHGKCRADIAVVNGCLIGFEIKGNKDSLSRLPSQIGTYNAIFDRVAIIVTENHLDVARDLVPAWWGIILCVQGKRGAISFITRRKGVMNPQVEPFAVAQLLWRSEVVDILKAKGELSNITRKPRALLYTRLVEMVTRHELKDTVRSCLMNRINWRRLRQPSEHDDLSQPIAR